MRGCCSRVRARIAIVDFMRFVDGSFWGGMKPSLSSHTCTEVNGLGGVTEGSKSLSECFGDRDRSFLSYRVAGNK